MNALDFLVDFAIGTSTSASMTISMGDNGKQNPLGSQCSDSAPNFKRIIAGTPKTGRPHEVAPDDRSRYKPTLSAQQSTSIPSSRLSPPSTSRDRKGAEKTDAAISQPPTKSSEHPITRTVVPHLQEEPGPYREYKCGAPYAHCSCSANILSKAFHAFDYVVPTEDRSWGPYLPQPPLYGVQQHLECPTPEDQLLCRNPSQSRLWNRQDSHLHGYCINECCLRMVARDD